MEVHIFGYQSRKLTNIDPWANLQPANILFTVADLSNIRLSDPERSPVQWLPGVATDQSAPQYLLASQRPRGMLDDADYSTLIVKIGDLGGGGIPHRRSSKMHY